MIVECMALPGRGLVSSGLTQGQLQLPWCCPTAPSLTRHKPGKPSSPTNDSITAKVQNRFKREGKECDLNSATWGGLYLWTFEKIYGITFSERDLQINLDVY